MSDNKLTWKAPIELDDGQHNGIIKYVERKLPSETNNYDYFEVWICEESGVMLKYSCPANLSTKTRLGRLMISLGIEEQEGNEIDISELLINKKVTFMTMKKNIQKKDKTFQFSEIVEDSIKLYSQG